MGEGNRASRERRAAKYDEIAAAARHLARSQSTPEDPSILQAARELLAKRKAHYRTVVVDGKHMRQPRVSFQDFEALARWYGDRARGERERIDRAHACGTFERAHVRCCTGCGITDEQRHELVACGQWAYCVSCRGADCARIRAEATAAIENWRKVYYRELHRPFAPYSERMLTLTVPHTGDAALDFDILQRAWRWFSRALRKWFALRHAGARDFPYLRVLELTGSDDGHAHCHVWMLGPYLPHHVARFFWGRALGRDARVPYVPVLSVAAVREHVSNHGPVCGVIRCGHRSCGEARRGRASDREVSKIARYRKKPISFMPWPVLDVRRGDGDIAFEIVKYFTVDKVVVADKVTGEFVDPLEYARLIEAMHGRRLVCASRHLWVDLPPRVCEHCEVKLQRLNIKTRPLLAQAARGPPLPSIPIA